jgi:hypothetical protein
MAGTEAFLGLMQADPETLPGVPTNQQIIEEDDELRGKVDDLTPAVRSGYLQMWQMTYVREQIQNQTAEELALLHDEVYQELCSPDLLERRSWPLRFVLNAVNSAHPQK